MQGDVLQDLPQILDSPRPFGRRFFLQRSDLSQQAREPTEWRSTEFQAARHPWVFLPFQQNESHLALNSRFSIYLFLR